MPFAELSSALSRAVLEDPALIPVLRAMLSSPQIDRDYLYAYLEKVERDLAP